VKNRKSLVGRISFNLGLTKMNYLIYVLSWIGFLVLPVLLLSIRLLYEKIMPWWLLTLLVLILSWVLTNSGVHFYYEYLSDLIESTPDPSRKLMGGFGADGAKLVFTLFFGWLYGCVYLLPWLLIYQILKLLQRRRSVLTGPIMKKKVAELRS